MELAILPFLTAGLIYIINKSNNDESPQQTIENFEPQDVEKTNVPLAYNTKNTETAQYINQHEYKQTADPKMKELYTLGGEKLRPECFTHNNMTPFYGGKIKGTLKENTSEILLDNMVGAGSTSFKKTEQTPLFKPETNIQWGNGAPNNTSFFRERAIQNIGMKNNNDLPFEQERVGAGLNKGFASEGSDGYNSVLQERESYMPKSIDEFRVKTKAEFNYLGHQGPVTAQVKNMGTIGHMDKHGHDGFFDNTPDRWLKTTGSTKKPVMESFYNMDGNSRSVTSQYSENIGPLLGESQGYVKSETREPHREDSNPVSMNTRGIMSKTTSLEVNKDTMKKTNRSINDANTQSRTYGLKNLVSAGMAPIMNILKPTKKEETLANANIYGYIGSGQNSSYVNNQLPLKITTKETTIHSSRSNVAHIHNTSDITIEPVYNASNRKDGLNDNTTFRPAGSIHTAARNYNAEYNQTLNDKKDSKSRIEHGNMAVANNFLNMNFAKTDNNMNRSGAPKLPIGNAPSIYTYGEQEKTNGENIEQKKGLHTLGVDRIHPEILDAFRENPYTFPLNSYA